MHTIILANHTGRIAVLCAAFLAHARAHALRTDTTELTSNGPHGYIASHTESVHVIHAANFLRSMAWRRA